MVDFWVVRLLAKLAGLGLLQQTDDAYPVLMLTARGVGLLKDEHSVPGLVLARQRAVRKDAPRPQSRVEAESWQDVDRALSRLRCPSFS